MSEDAEERGTVLSWIQIALYFTVQRSIAIMSCFLFIAHIVEQSGKWQINYIDEIRLLFKQLSRAMSGEFLDKSDIAKRLNKVFGIANEIDEGPEDKTGIERMGTDDILQNFG